MRTLLGDLCDELESRNAGPRAPHTLPVAYLRLLGRTLEFHDFDHWKVVGWIENLNDLVYFVDVRRQLAQERDVPEFSEQLLAECAKRLYENSYLDDLFPRRAPDPDRLAGRLDRLCRRLSREILQESLWLAPGLPCRWLSETGRRLWMVPGTLAANYERVEVAGRVAVGLDGATVRVPKSSGRRSRFDSKVTQFVISPTKIAARAGHGESTICTMEHDLTWHWDRRPPVYILQPDPNWSRGLTLGPTLVYDRYRVPMGVFPSPVGLGERIRTAIAAINQAWPEGYTLLALLTSRVVPLRAKGVVSFSYRHRPGLSFINLFDRNQLDLVDDLIHENSHHHLNLLLRKALFYKGDDNQEIFYSPWRRSLRPLRGILHATFTFTMGALLFERLSQFGRRQPGQWEKLGLSDRDLIRARFRCLEERESVRYSLKDLVYADQQRGWLSVPGRRLVRQLTAEMQKVERSARQHERAIRGTEHGKALNKHISEIRTARRTYGPDR
ncbi:hypothetical protein YTPLAS18_26620 [Nitrospira sp.]|nr:hypothetical protein YTPLAS18_26620 [Nitrospira sp.]